MSFSFTGSTVNVNGNVTLAKDVSAITTIAYVGAGGAQIATVPANKVWIVTGMTACQTGATAGFVNVKGLGLYAVYSASTTAPSTYAGLLKLIAGETLVYNGAVTITYEQVSV
jgi:hypothetical protein